MTRVLIMSEDRTGSGLNQMIIAAARYARERKGFTPLEFLPAGTVDGRDRLLKKCSAYSLLRFGRPPRPDHVFYVMDARGAEDSPSVLLPSLRSSSGLPWTERHDELSELCRAAMARNAQANISDWDRNKSGFHPHVLIWERESLLLPVLADLGLGESEHEPYKVRAAAELVREWLPRYSKHMDGARYLKQIAGRIDLIDKVLASNGSLRAIIEDLVSL